MKIIKRNGTEVPYDYRKIQRASLIAEIVKALGWETMDEGRFSREVSRVLVSDDDVQVEC